MKRLIHTFLLLCVLQVQAQINIGSLTTTPLSTAGSEKIPMSGPGNPATTVVNMGQWILGMRIVPVQFSSVSDQSSVISAAITSASAGDVLYFGSGVIKIESQITVSKTLHFVGTMGTIFRTTSNISMLVFSGSSGLSTITGIEFQGNDAGASQIGLNISTGPSGIQVKNCTFRDLNQYGLRFTASTGSPFYLNRVENCYAISCPGSGFFIEADYTQMVSCFAGACGTGYNLTTGNLGVYDCNATGNTGTGFYYNGGLNSGHCIFEGIIANHNNIGFVVNAVDGVLGFSIVGIQCFANTFQILDGTVVQIVNLETDSQITTSNVTKPVFQNCIIHSGAGNVTGTSTANVVWTNCFKDDGTAYSGTY